MKKQITITLLFLILLASVVYCTAPTVTHYGLQIFSDGVTVKNGNLTVTDANSVARFSVDPNGTAIIGGSAVGSLYGENDFVAAFYHSSMNSCPGISQTVTGNTYIDCADNKTVYLRNNSTNIATISSTGLAIAPGKTITQDGLITKKYSGSLADDATITLPTGVCGMLRVWSEAEHGTFYIDANGVVTFDSMSSNMDDADTDTKLCVYDGGTGGIIKNRLGSEKKIRYTYEYSTE